MRLLPLAGSALAVLALAAWVLATPWSPQPATTASGVEAALADALGIPAQRLLAAPASLAHDRDLRPQDTLLVVVAPPHAFSSSDRDAVAAFVGAGGTLLVADDAGEANSLLGAFGLGFERVRLAESTPQWSWSTQPRLELPSPTALLLDGDGGVLAWSSERSFLDRDGDGVIGASDPAGPFPVAARVAHGEGLVLAVADADALGPQAAAANAGWLRQALGDAAPSALLVHEPEAGDPVLSALAWARTVAAGPLRPVMAVAIVPLLAYAWSVAARPWGAHRFRPLHFRRRAALAAPGEQRAGLTERGALAVVAAPALAAAWAVTGSAEAAFAAAGLLAALAMACVVRVPRVRGQRTVGAARCMEGTAVEVAVELTATRPARLELHDAVPKEADVTAGSPWALARVSRSPSTLRYELAPALRGHYELGPLRARAQDAFGLRVHEASVVPAAQLTVTPRAVPAGRTPLSTRKAMQTLGSHRVNRAGDGTEFHALRPYLPGDPFRSVNWKASARSRDLMVNQRVHESMTSLTIFLDARAIAGAGPAARTPFARSCRAALSVGLGTGRSRDRMRLVVYGDGVRELPPQPAARQAHELTSLLSDLSPAGDTPLADAIAHAMPALRPGLPVMVLSGFEADDTAVEALASLAPRGVRPFVVAAPPLAHPVDAEDGGPEPGSERIEAEHAETLARLRSRGIPVYTLDVDGPIDGIFQRGVAA